jgi:anti-anti-sigma factor
VRLHGNQNIATDEVLCTTLADAIAHGDAPVLIDLTEVGAMGLSTLAVLLRARELLRMWSRSRSLTLWSPPESTRRLVDICGVSDLLAPQEPPSPSGKLLSSPPAVPTPRYAGLGLWHFWRFLGQAHAHG